jgi:hypothetical protein
MDREDQAEHVVDPAFREKFKRIKGSRSVKDWETALPIRRTTKLDTYKDYMTCVLNTSIPLLSEY